MSTGYRLLCTFVQSQPTSLHTNKHTHTQTQATKTHTFIHMTTLHTSELHSLTSGHSHPLKRKRKTPTSTFTPAPPTQSTQDTVSIETERTLVCHMFSQRKKKIKKMYNHFGANQKQSEIHLPLQAQMNAQPHKSYLRSLSVELDKEKQTRRTI